MPNNPYAAPAANLAPSQSTELSLYTPIQVATGTFFGGPLAAIYLLHANFKQLEAHDFARNTLVWGTVLLVALFALIAVLPDEIPGLPFTLAYTFGARALVEKYQLGKQAIFESGHRLQSNWKVFGVAVAGIAVLLAVVGVVVFGAVAVGLMD